MTRRVGEKYRHLVPTRACQCCDPRLRAFTIRANAEISRRGFVAGLAAAAGLGASGLPIRATAETAQPAAVMFEGVRIFDGKSPALSAPANVLVVGNTIRTISPAPIAAPANIALTRIRGGGRTLTPGFIDAHAHVMFEVIRQIAILTSDVEFVTVAAVKAAHDMVMRGFTSIRDVGGPTFGLKRGIEAGLAVGPRIWPSDAFISQSGGRGDFRLPNELPARPGDFSHGEQANAAVIADDPDTVRKRAREQLALGASQIKLMAGGGVASSYDPLDVTQYTVPELRAGVEAAENSGTYATVHAYTPRAVRQALEAGVRCIEHGQLLDEPTVRQREIRRSDRRVDGRKADLVESPAVPRQRGCHSVPRRFRQPRQAAAGDRRHRRRLPARQAIWDQHRLGHRHPFRRQARRAPGPATFQAYAVAYARRDPEDGYFG